MNSRPAEKHHGTVKLSRKLPATIRTNGFISSRLLE
jgi:hypothetical protein